MKGRSAERQGRREERRQRAAQTSDRRTQFVREVEEEEGGLNASRASTSEHKPGREGALKGGFESSREGGPISIQSGGHKGTKGEREGRAGGEINSGGFRKYQGEKRERKRSLVDTLSHRRKE